MRKTRNKQYNPQKLQTMRNQGKVSRSVPLIALTPGQVALKIRAKQIIKQNSLPEVSDQRQVTAGLQMAAIQRQKEQNENC